jgi:hypothetical protein
MNNSAKKGISTMEFAFSMLVLTPLLLGTGVTGINMIRTLATVQLARDAGHMYARGLDFAPPEPGNQTILKHLGSNLGLNTDGTGTAIVIFSTLAYIDKAACAGQGLVDGAGNPSSACTNYTRWVFANRVVVGNTSVRTSNYGSPLTSGPTGVTIDSQTGNISVAQQVTKAGARATFTGVNPYSVVGTNVSGLPSGQVLYLAEAAATGFSMPPFVNGSATYSWGLF